MEIFYKNGYTKYLLTKDMLRSISRIGLIKSID